MVDLIRPSNLPAAPSVGTNAAIAIDTGAEVLKATPKQITDAGFPIASEAQARAGVSNSVAMTPLGVRQAFEYLVDLSQASRSLGTSDLNAPENWAIGVAYQSQSSNATSARNYPIGRGGTLIVNGQAGGYLTQMYCTIEGVAVRQSTNGGATASAWGIEPHTIEIQRMVDDTLARSAAFSTVMTLGSSTIEGMASRIGELTAAQGLSFNPNGFGSDTIGGSAFIAGNNAPTITFTGNIINNGANAVVVSWPWTDTPRPAQVRQCILPNGVRGTLARVNDTSGTFTASLPLGPVIVSGPVLCQVVSGLFAQSQFLIFNSGKNNITSASPPTAAWLLQHTREITDSWHDQSRVCVMGHFANTNADSAQITLVQDTNAALLGYYGRNYFGLIELFEDDATWTALGLTKTSADITALAAKRLPPSLSRDNGHMSAAMSAYAADRLFAYLVANSFFTSSPASSIALGTSSLDDLSNWEPQYDYYQSLSANATSARGYPIARGGTLRVTGNPNGFRTQTYATVEGIAVRHRTGNTSTPTAWNIISSSAMPTDFPTRDALVSWAASNTPAVGHVANAGGYAYRYVGGVTTLPSLSGWVPEGDVYVDHFGQNTSPGVTDMLTAFNAAGAYLSENGGGRLYLRATTYGVTDTWITPAGVQPQGDGKRDLWGETVGLGTTILGIGAGTKRRWRDVDGSDVADENPLVVAGGNGVYYRDITFDCPSGANAWTRAIMYPCVKQCGFERIQTTNRFSRRSVLLDLTWSNRNSTLIALHPAVKTSAGMNEFWGVNCFLHGGLEVGGTTRDPADYTSENWIWGWAGGSDLHFAGIRGGGLRVDAAVKNHAGTVQGVWFHDCAWRVDAKWPAISLDRANRVVFVSGYGEETGSAGTARLELTSRSNNISFISGRYNGFDIWYNGVNTGVKMEDGNAGIDGLTIITEHGLTYIGDYEIRPDRLNPRVASSRDVGTASLPFGSVFATKLESATGGSVAIRANGDTVAEAFSVGLLLDKVIRPRTDGAVGLGTAAYKFSAVRANNAFISDYLAVGGQDASAARVYGGSGAPTSTTPNGSLYMRTDGAAGSTLYCRVAGAWVAVA